MLSDAQIFLRDQVIAAYQGLGIEKNVRFPPTVVPDVDSLKDKTILMVDDTMTLFLIYVPALIDATGGRSRFIRYQHPESLESLTDKIMSASADIILMDHNLGTIFFGNDVIAQLKRKGCKSLMIGFSNSPSPYITKEFNAAGAATCIAKSTILPEKSLKTLADFVKAQPKPSP